MLEKKASMSVFGVWESIMKSLCDRVKTLGGNFEAIRFLVKPEGCATLEAVAQTIVNGYNAYQSAAAIALVDACSNPSAGDSIIVSRTTYVIDCDADPFVPNGWKVEKHIKGGGFEWDLSRVELFLDNEQQNGKSIVGNKLRKKLAKLTGVLNACVLDFLLAHPKLIPEEWKGKAIFFWGTIYRHSDGYLCVRYLYWNDDGWGWYCYWLGHDFYGDRPAALCK